MSPRDWGHPTVEMLAALRLARRCAARHGLTEIQTAEWIMDAHASLWYLQAAAWADEPPRDVVEDVRPFFQAGCRYVVQVVDLGYDAEARAWWPHRKLWPAEAEWGGVLLVLMDLGLVMRRLSERQDAIVSAGFGIFLSIVCGPRWAQRRRAMVAATEQRVGFPPRRGRQR